MVHGHQGPVGDDASDANAAAGRARHQILDACGVEELDVGQLQHLDHQRGREEGGVAHDDEVALVFVGHTHVVEKDVGRLAHHHGGEELAAEPGAAAGRHRRFDDGNLEVRARPAQNIGSAEAARAGADDDHVRLSVSIQVRKVTPRHGPRHLALADGREAEVVTVAG